MLQHAYRKAVAAGVGEEPAVRAARAAGVGDSRKRRLPRERARERRSTAIAQEKKGGWISI